MSAGAGTGARAGAGPAVADRVLLPLGFDAKALAAEARALPRGAWEPHFNTACYEGDWSGVALRAPAGAGAANALYPDPTASAWADTDALRACPRIAAALAAFRCPLLSVRLLRLGPGATIKEHRDYRLGFADGEVRLHVPLTTGPDVHFVLAGTPVPMRAGECWYLDLNLPHRVANRGAGARVNLVVDCQVDAWFTELLIAASAGGASVAD
ncbi:MAG: aspartyl/asparaginyl beta-hydroxylase domain-containing protein [Acidimicrobiales bacterium]